MKKYGLLGKKLGHSLSPFIHSILFEISGEKAEYKLYETDNVEQFLQSVKLDGFNITIPYKKEIFNFCSSIHESAVNLGVVNCVDNNMIGYNTDVYGYRESVKEIEENFNAKVLLLGCGGVGNMIAKQYDANNLWVAIRNVTEDRISEITSKFKGSKVVDIQNIPCEKFDIIVNSTPIGMFPNIDNSPIPKGVVANSKCVYDTIYNPYTTKLLEYASEVGVKYKNGLEMLVLQAAKSHEYWYGATFKGSDIKDILTLTKKEIENKW